MKKLILFITIWALTSANSFATEIIEMTFPELCKELYEGSLKPSNDNYHFVVRFELGEKSFMVYLFEVHNEHSDWRRELQCYIFNLDELYSHGGGIYDYTDDSIRNTVVMVEDGFNGSGIILEKKNQIDGKFKLTKTFSFSDGKIRKKKANRNSPYLETKNSYLSKIKKINDYLINNSEFGF